VCISRVHPSDFFLSLQEESAPSVLDPNVCLLPGVPIVRIEVAPGNARRIFTGIDIVADCGDVLEVGLHTHTHTHTHIGRYR